MQVELIVLENLKNVILINFDVIVDWLIKVVIVCIYVDVILLLFVLYYMKDVEKFLLVINKILKFLIIEMLNLDELRVCGKDVLKN